MLVFCIIMALGITAFFQVASLNTSLEYKAVMLLCVVLLVVFAVVASSPYSED